MKKLNLGVYIFGSFCVFNIVVLIVMLFKFDWTDFYRALLLVVFSALFAGFSYAKPAKLSGDALSDTASSLNTLLEDTMFFKLVKSNYMIIAGLGLLFMLINGLGANIGIITPLITPLALLFVISGLAGAFMSGKLMHFSYGIAAFSAISILSFLTNLFRKNGFVNMISASNFIIGAFIFLIIYKIASEKEA